MPPDMIVRNPADVQIIALKKHGLEIIGSVTTRGSRNPCSFRYNPNSSLTPAPGLMFAGKLWLCFPTNEWVFFILFPYSVLIPSQLPGWHIAAIPNTWYS